MSLTTSVGSMSRLSLVRTLSAAMAVIIVVDAVSVGAPGLAIMAVPFMIAAAMMKQGRALPAVALAAWSLFYVVIGVNYALANGFDAGWGDLLFAYLGTPVAAILAVTLGQHLRGRAHMRAA